MTLSSLPRRTLLQSGAALAGPLALAGVWPRSGHAAPIAAAVTERPISGTLAGWVTVEPDRGTTVRLVQLDAASRPVRQVAAELTFAESGASLQQICQRAHDMALDAVARSWGVPMAECVVEPGNRIAHAAQGRSVGYTLWVDIA